jgi:hypothetical protein
VVLDSEQYSPNWKKNSPSVFGLARTHLALGTALGPTALTFLHSDGGVRWRLERWISRWRWR